MAQQKLPSLSRLRGDLDDLCEAARVQGALTTAQFNRLKEIIVGWNLWKPHISPTYHPIMDDRISAAMRYVPNSIRPAEYRD